MSRDARIRLEGKLEVFEGAVATLGAAVVRARRGEFRALGTAMDLDVEEARAQLARLSAPDPELEALQRRWVCLQAEAATVVRARARLMKVAEQPVRRALEALVAEPVGYEGVARHPLGLLAPVVLGLFAAAEVAVLRHPAPLILHGSVAVYLFLQDWLSPFLRVTSRRMFIGKQVFELADLKGIEIERLMVRSTRPYRLTATLEGGGHVQLRLPYVPERFTAALRRARLAVTCNDWGWP